MFRALIISLFLVGNVVADEPTQDAPDGGAPAPSSAPAPQSEDREAPPMENKPKPGTQQDLLTNPPPATRTAPQKAEPQTQPQTETAPPPAPEPVRKSPPRVTAHAYDEESTGALADAAETAIGEELSGDSRIKFTSVSDILDPPDVSPRTLGAADLDAVDSDDAMATGDADKAKNLLEKALTTYQKYLPQLATRGGGLLPFRDAWMKLAKARFFDGDQKGARDAMRYVFVLDPTVKWDPKVFPPAMKKVVVEARLLYDTLGTGSLSIDSDPPGATVYLNGIKLDKTTPLDGVPAPPGPNYISYVRRGWQPTTAIFEVAGGGEQATAVRALDHYPGRPLQPVLRARGELDKNDTPGTLKDGADKLGVDMILLVRLTKTDMGNKVSVYLYDARPNKILKRAEKEASDEEVGNAARELSKQLLGSVRLDGIIVAAPPPKRASWNERMSAKMHAFRHSKAFWYVIGGVAGAVVIGAAVGIGVGVGTQPHGLSPGAEVVLIGGR